MTDRLMLLPAHDHEHMRLLRIPEDFGERDAMRHVTALIAEMQEESPDLRWEEIATALEDHGFSVVPFMIGPALD